MQHIIDRLVNKAIERYQLQRIEKYKIKTDWKPDIVISRDPGSGGNPIAKKLTKKLGWRFFNKDLMLELSKELGIPTEELTHVDEHSRNWATDFVHSIFNPSYVSDMLYITHLKKILIHAAKDGDMVILGRGANLILPPNKCLRVRITASLKTRIDNTYKYEKYATKAEAEARVKHVESHRNQFIRQYFGANPHNPWNYDLVISTDHLSLDQAVEIILQAYLIKFPQESKRIKSKLSL
jgi:cytidylate kinase